MMKNNVNNNNNINNNNIIKDITKINNKTI